MTQTISCATCGARYETQSMGDIMLEEEDARMVAACPVTHDWDKRFLTPTDYKADLNGKVLVLKPTTLGARWQRAKFQLVACTGGFGASPDKLGRKVFGTHLADDEETQFERSDVLGEATTYLIGLAARDKAPEAPLDPSLRSYLAIGQGGYWARGDSEKAAKAKLKGLRSRCLMVFHCHPETQVTDMGSLRWPEAAARPEVVWETKRK